CITSSRPKRSTAWATMATTDDSSVMSTATASAVPPSDETASTVPPAASVEMSATTTAAPSAANRRAVARPMPPPPPVTITTRPSNRCAPIVSMAVAYQPFGRVATMEAWEPGAREAIRELVARYTHFGDGGRIKELTELFEPDAVIDAVGTGTFNGHDAI